MASFSEKYRLAVKAGEPRQGSLTAMILNTAVTSADFTDKDRNNNGADT